MDKLRLGMIGGGEGAFIGPVHRIAARLDRRFDLVAGAFSSDPERSRQSGAALGLDPARVYGDWRAMLAGEAGALDAVAIVTPNHLHAAPAIAALDAGLHVICDKPLAASLSHAEAIAAAVARSGRVFVLTHQYAAYPMIRQARAMIASGALGALRMIRVEYAQDWLTRPLENEGHKQAAWRVDPAQAGPGGALGDIGTHAYQLASFVTGLKADALCADLQSFGAGRVLDDNAQMLLAYPGGARGTLWISQVAPGKTNGLQLSIYGSDAGLEWGQEHPNQLRFTRFGEPAQILERGGPSAMAQAYGVRVPAGHPEGYLEALAQIYADAAELIDARNAGRAPSVDPGLVPGVEDGVEGLRFVLGAVASSKRRAWLSRAEWVAE
jgi:predicted dehydrogenase